jgi:general secretion pathway protein D
MAKVLDGVVKGITAQAGQPGAAALQLSPLDSGKVTITADKGSNSLVIMASPNDYNNLVQVIKKLDRRSKQVFVQVLIAEVSLDKQREIGVQSGVLGAYVANNLAGAAFYDPFGAFSSLLQASAVQQIISNNPNLQFDKPVNIVSVLKALDSNNLLNVLSTPNILTSDNKEAEIFVGENVPFSGGSTISSGVSTTSTERKDVGINLKITPQISEGDYIRLAISQEISALKDTIVVGNGSVDRTTTKRSAKTSVVVKDNETVVIGGLIQDQEQEIISKVPFLGDIPGLGWLFKTKSKSRQKTNLLILLTPTIVKNADDLNGVSEGQRLKFGEAAKNLDPVDVKKEMSEKGFRPAQGPQEAPAK